MLNKKIVLGLFAAFALVSPATANEIQAGQTNQIVNADTTAADGSVAVTKTNQDAYLGQHNINGYGDVQGGTINQIADIDTTAVDHSIAVTETNQDAFLGQQLVDPYNPYYGQ